MPAVSGNCSDVLHGRLKFLTTHHQERTSTKWGTTQLFLQVVLVPNVLVDRHTTIQNWVYLWCSHFVRISARCLHVWRWGRKGLPKRPLFIQVLRPTLVFVENVNLSFETCRKIYIHNTYGLCSTSKTTYRNIFVSTLYRFTQIYTHNVSALPPVSPNKTAVFSMYIYYNTRALGRSWQGNLTSRCPILASIRFCASLGANGESISCGGFWVISFSSGTQAWESYK